MDVERKDLFPSIIFLFFGEVELRMDMDICHQLIVERPTYVCSTSLKGGTR